MKYLLPVEQKGSISFKFTESDPLSIGNNQVRISVRSIGVNRADLLQKQGLYPPPKGESEIIGLEISGVITETGINCTRFKGGDKVFALLAGGGYAHEVVVDERLVMNNPVGLSFEQCAGIAEVFITAYQAMIEIGKLKRGECILIHAGASGLGTAAIQLASSIGARTVVTVGTDNKADFCRKLGADHTINYRKEDFESTMSRLGLQADVIIDPIGASYFQKNVAVAATDCRWVLLAFLGGRKVEEINITKFLVKRINLVGSTLRSRSLDYKSHLITEFSKRFLPLFQDGQLKPIMDRVFPWEEVDQAHAYIEANKNIGKVILRVE